MNKQPQPFAIDVSCQKQLAGFSIDANFQAGGGITALFGRSGSGKTTIINMLAGLDQPDHGVVRIDGQEVFNAGENINIPPERRHIGYVFQEGLLFPHMTVVENLKYGARFHKKTGNETDFHNIVDLLQLGNILNRRPKSLSGGEKQRVAIGRAILKKPDLLLMDEPLASLDDGLKTEILKFIERLRDELSLAIVYVSHSMEEVIRLADTIILLDQGKTIAQGSVEEIMNNLDLWPYTGRHEAGAVFPVKVVGHDLKYGLTELAFAGGRLVVSKLEALPGSELRVRIRARDVTISLEKPNQTSVLNVFKGQITDIRSHDETPQCEVKVDIGVPVIVRITRKSLYNLSLETGKNVYLMIKSAAIDRHSMGLGGTRKRREF